MKTRIIRREKPDGSVTYVIQQRHFLFFWWWVDAWMNNASGPACKDEFNLLEEARKNICYFDGSKCKETVVG